jgi:peptide chain release factor 2
LQELDASTQVEGFWDRQDSAKELLKEIADLRGKLAGVEEIESGLVELDTGLELLALEYGSSLSDELFVLVRKLDSALGKIEFQQKMSGEFDHLNAFLEINAGGGGTDAQDWASMLLRMYLRWAEQSGFAAEVVDMQAGEVAGIKSASVFITGSYVYGRLRSEIGVHRLVRISPFNANGKRQTSFASVSVAPDVPEDGDLVVDEKDLRVDTYRSSGAGGQHINKTDSAVRITHVPTGVVVACQTDRSQHKNRERAMSMLRAKLFELEQEKRIAAMAEIKGVQNKIDFGSQIRSYVLHPYKMVKDSRTAFETSAVDSVLDGELDGLMEAFLLNSATNQV